MKNIIKSLIKKLKTANRLFVNTIKSLHQDGIRITIRRIKLVSKKVNGLKTTTSVMNLKSNCEYMALHKPSKEYLDRQREMKFENKVVFSIIVPLYNTPKEYLIEMIDSVVGQTYEDWELCLADGSDSKHQYVEQICQQYQKEDCRIKYHKLTSNEGISGNTNQCIKMATGNYIFLFDHDDVLHPSALFKSMEKIEGLGADFIYSDEMVFEGTVENCVLIHFKPDFSPDTLRSHNYICHLCCFKKELMQQVGLFSLNHDGSQDYDMILRLTEVANCIVHIPEVLYFWRSHPGSVASDVSVKPYCMDSAAKAIQDHLVRIGLKGTIEGAPILSTYKINYQILGQPKISIIIPNKDHVDILDVCLKSIFSKTTYSNYEIIIVENNSKEEATFEYYENIKSNYSSVKIVIWDGPWNYSAINNFGVKFASGEYYLLLNNDVEVITPKWLEEMLMYVQREDVGASGALLYYPDDTIQHAGLILGLGGLAAHSHRFTPRNTGGYMHRTCVVQNLSGVTGACLMTKRSVWEELNGLDEEFEVAFNDVDFCLRIRDKGYNIIFTPFAELYHFESKSRGYEDTPEKIERMNKEGAKLRERWGEVIDKGDPYYNPNLTTSREDFSFK